MALSTIVGAIGFVPVFMLEIGYLVSAMFMAVVTILPLFASTILLAIPRKA